jgi:GNAT superfamily N-acetyltransferase
VGTARPAVPSDVSRLATLCRQALSELASTRGGELFVVREARCEPFEASFAEDLQDDGRGLWVGEFDGVALGYGVVAEETLRDGTLLAVITDLYVEPGAREVGVGEAIMTSILAWATERRCRGVDAIALPGERLTKNFFEASGFTARMLVMHHRL